MTHRNEEATMIVTVDDLRHFTGALFSTAGVPADDAALAARILTDATVRGVDTHGASAWPDQYQNVPHEAVLNTNFRSNDRPGPASGAAACAPWPHSLPLTCGRWAMPPAQAHAVRWWSTGTARAGASLPSPAGPSRWSAAGTWRPHWCGTGMGGTGASYRELERTPPSRP